MRSLFAAALKFKHGEPHAAMRELRYAARQPATCARALVVAGEVAYAEDRFRDAESYFQNAVKLDPTSTEANRWLAIVYYDIGLLDRVIDHLQRVADLDPRDPRPHRVMAVIHIDRHAPAVAVEDFEESLRRNGNQPDRDDILLELAETQLILNRFEDVLSTLSDLPASADVLALRSECFYSLGDEDRAKQCADESLNLTPGQRLAVRVRGKLAIDDRRYDEAVEVLSAGVKKEPADYDMRYTLLTALRAAGRVDEAEEQVRSVEELRKLRDDFDDLLDEAVSKPYSADLRYELGILASKLNLSRFAEAWFRAAVALDAGHDLARAELSKLGSSSPRAAALLRGT